MAIDWTKPIQQKNGKALRLLCELQSNVADYPVVCVVTQDDGNEYVVTYTKDGLYNRDNKRGSTYDVENIPDTEPAQPEIDWAGKLQVSAIDENDNKPAEPKPVQAILKMFRSPSFGITMRAYLKNEATTMASVRRWHEDTEGELLDVIEVDLHNVEGLEDGK